MIIERYIYRELFQKLIWILGLLVLVFASNKFVGFLADAAEGNLPGDMVFMMLGFKMLGTLPKIFPIAIMIAILLAFSRMASDRELVIFAASGVSKMFQIITVVKFAVIYCLIVSFITLYVAPWAEQNMHDLGERAKQESDISGIKPGQFKEFSRGNRVVYVQETLVDNLSMQEVFLQVRQEVKESELGGEGKEWKEGKKWKKGMEWKQNKDWKKWKEGDTDELSKLGLEWKKWKEEKKKELGELDKEGKLGILTSDSANFKLDKKSGYKYIVFNNGRRYVGEPGLLDYQITDFEKYALLTEKSKADVAGAKTAALTTAEIFNSNSLVHQAEFQWRLSLIISCFLLSILAVLLTKSHTNERQYLPIVIGISIYLIYSNLLGIAQTLLKRDVVPAIIGLWWAHLLLLLLLLILYYLPIVQYRKKNEDNQLILAE